MIHSLIHSSQVTRPSKEAQGPAQGGGETCFRICVLSAESNRNKFASSQARKPTDNRRKQGGLASWRAGRLTELTRTTGNDRSHQARQSVGRNLGRKKGWRAGSRVELRARRLRGCREVFQPRSSWMSSSSGFRPNFRWERGCWQTVSPKRIFLSLVLFFSPLPSYTILYSNPSYARLGYARLLE